MTSVEFGMVSADILADLYWEYGDVREMLIDPDDIEEDDYEPEFDDV